MILGTMGRILDKKHTQLEQLIEIRDEIRDDEIGNVIGDELN